MGDYLTQTAIIISTPSRHGMDFSPFRSHAIQCEYTWCLLFRVSKFVVVQNGTMAFQCVQTLFFKTSQITICTPTRLMEKLPAWGLSNTNWCGDYKHHPPTHQQVSVWGPMPLHTYTIPTRLDQLVLVWGTIIIGNTNANTYSHKQVASGDYKHQCHYIYTHTNKT